MVVDALKYSNTPGPWRPRGSGDGNGLRCGLDSPESEFVLYLARGVFSIFSEVTPTRPPTQLPDDNAGAQGHENGDTSGCEFVFDDGFPVCFFVVGLVWSVLDSLPCARPTSACLSLRSVHGLIHSPDPRGTRALCWSTRMMLWFCNRSDKLPNSGRANLHI